MVEAFADEDTAIAMNSPTERLAKAVGIMARRNPPGADQLVLAWRRAQLTAEALSARAEAELGVMVPDSTAVLEALRRTMPVEDKVT